MTKLLLLSLLLSPSACAGAQVQNPGSEDGEARFSAEAFIADDGYRMPLSRWLPAAEPRGVVLALHGFNDFRQSHEGLGRYLAADGLAVYAYDQRGFGGTEQRGIWPGGEVLVRDAVTALNLLAARYPEQPLYLLGESMGAAVAILALGESSGPELAGTVLMAPAVWARDTQPWYQRWGLWLGQGVIPGMKVDADWVAVEPTDDPNWAQYWDEHPLVIKRARLDALDGLTELMGQALAAWPTVRQRLLVLYGGEDEVIPPAAICAMIQKRPAIRDDKQQRFVFYEQGWHFLARDSRAEETLSDIAAWLGHPAASLPSGRELGWPEARQRLCED